ncbi:MAG: MFS transporter [Alphaproteobacteria bacterium]
MSDSGPPTGAVAPRPFVSIILVIFLPFAAGFFMSYLLRTVNAVIAPNLVQDIGLSAGDLGFLTAAYFLSFALMQLPVGVTLDRWGPRRVQSALLTIAVAGALVFAMAETRTMLFVGRAMIGIGCAGGLMASLKAITLWFPRERWPLINGFFMATGGLGALVATAPIEAALHLTDWRGVFVGLAIAAAGASLLIFTVVPEKPGSAAPGRLSEQIAAVGRIFRDPFFWCVGPVAVIPLGISSGIQTLWAGPWLRDVGGLDRHEVAEHLFAIAIALTAGFVLAGIVTDLLIRKGMRLTQILGGSVVLLFTVKLLLALQLWPPNLALWVLFGLCANSAIVYFPILNQHFPADQVARVNTATNVLNFGVAFLSQAAIGWIIDLWPALGDGRYPAEAYRWAFLAVIATEVLAFLWFLKPVRRR